MNSIPSSKLGGLALTLVLAVALTGTAVAAGAGTLAFDTGVQGLQDEYRVGSDASVTYVISDPFTNVSNQYRLKGETELTNVSWTVTVFRAGNQVNQSTYGGDNFSRAMNIDNNGDEIRLELEGTVPAVGNYTYPEEEQFLVANLTRVSGNNPTTFQTDRAHHYTADSKDARESIEEAQEAIDEAGGHAEAQELLQSAITSYRENAFQSAESVAQQAQNRAEQAQSSAQTTQLILMAVGAIIVVGLLVGGFLYWRSQQDEYSKL